MSTAIVKNLQLGSDPTATNNFTIFQPATPDGTLRIGNGNTGITSSLLTLTSAGNFGLGLSPAGQSGFRTLELGGSGVSGLLDLYQGTSRQMRLYNSGSNINIANNTSGGSTLFINVNASVGFFESMRLDSSGNLGLGVTPSAWTTYKAYQVGWGSIASYAAGDVGVFGNTYFDGSYRYIGTGNATHFRAINGVFQWFTAPSGTAGNAISFTQAMTLDASGNLLVGATSLNAQGQQEVTFNGSTKQGLNVIDSSAASTSTAISFIKSSGTRGSITVTASATAYNTSSDYRLKNITGPITTSGAYIDSLNPVEGTWKADGSTFVGLIAHEVQEASRTPVATGTKDGEQMQGMDYSSAEIIANMLAELKSLRARVAQLEAK